MKKGAKIDYVAIGLMKMARDTYEESEKYTKKLCEHLSVPDEWECNMWDYVIQDKTPMSEIKKSVKKWIRESEKKKLRQK